LFFDKQNHYLWGDSHGALLIWLIGGFGYLLFRKRIVQPLGCYWNFFDLYASRVKDRIRDRWRWWNNGRFTQAFRPEGPGWIGLLYVYSRDRRGIQGSQHAVIDEGRIDYSAILQAHLFEQPGAYPLHHSAFDLAQDTCRVYCLANIMAGCEVKNPGLA
jgi:hypothetical protein